MSRYWYLWQATQITESMAYLLHRTLVDNSVVEFYSINHTLMLSRAGTLCRISSSSSPNCDQSDKNQLKSQRSKIRPKSGQNQSKIRPNRRTVHIPVSSAVSLLLLLGDAVVVLSGVFGVPFREEPRIFRSPFCKFVIFSVQNSTKKHPKYSIKQHQNAPAGPPVSSLA